MKRVPIIGIYKITSPSGKSYIGQAVDIKRRFNVYNACCCKSQKKLYNSLIKHGVKNHKFEIIHTLEIYDKNKLNDLEEKYVLEFKCVEEGLNLKYGGGVSGKMSEEGKIRQSQIMKGRFIGENHPFYGKKHSDEAKRKNSDAHKGENNSLFGKKHSDETIKKMIESQKGNKNNLGKKCSEEKKEKIRQANKGKKPSPQTIARVIEVNTGRKASDETKKKLSLVQSGEKNPFYGKKHSDETKIKIGEANKRIRQEKLTMIF